MLGFFWCISLMLIPTCDVTVNQLLLLEGGRNAKLKGGGVSRTHGFSLTWMCFSKAPDTAHGGHHHMLIPQDAQTEKKTQGLLTTCQQRTAFWVAFKHSIFAGEKCASFVRV